MPLAAKSARADAAHEDAPADALGPGEGPPGSGGVEESDRTPRRREDAMQIPAETVRRIEEEIGSETSPVGIDAMKTHVIIIHMLEDIQRRLERIEARGVGGAS